MKLYEQNATVLFLDSQASSLLSVLSFLETFLFPIPHPEKARLPNFGEYLASLMQFDRLLVFFDYCVIWKRPD